LLEILVFAKNVSENKKSRVVVVKGAMTWVQ